MGVSYSTLTSSHNSDYRMHRAAQRLQPLVRAMSSSSSPLVKFSTCELSDALIKLGVPHGGHIPDIHILSPSPSSLEASTTRICGPAYTVQMVLGTDTSAPKLTSHFVDTTPAGSVVIIAAPPRTCSPSLPVLSPPTHHQCIYFSFNDVNNEQK